MSQKNKKKTEILRKYFYKFYHAGIIRSIRKNTRRATLYSLVEGVDLKTAFNTVNSNKAMKEIEIDENTNVTNFQEAMDKKMKEKEFAAEMEKIRKNEEENRKIEEEKEEQENKRKLRLLEIIFNKLDKVNRTIMKKQLEIYYLKSKVLSLDNYQRRTKRSKTTKIKKKSTKKTVMFNLDNNNNDDDNHIHRINSRFSPKTIKESDNENKITENNEDKKSENYDDAKSEIHTDEILKFEPEQDQD